MDEEMSRVCTTLLSLAFGALPRHANHVTTHSLAAHVDVSHSAFLLFNYIC